MARINDARYRYRMKRAEPRHLDRMTGHTPERLSSISLEILHRGTDARTQSTEWNDCVHKRIMSSCLKWNKARSRSAHSQDGSRLDG